MKLRNERDQQEHDADHPVELARRLVGAGEEHAAHVQEDDGHHAVRRPAVHVAQEDAEGHGAAQVEHAVVGLRGGRHVVEHQQHAGGDQDQEQEERDQAEPQGVDGPQRVAVDLDRVDVQEEVGEAGGRALQVRGGKGVAEDGAPDVGGQLAEGAPRAFFVVWVLIR